MLTAKLQSRAVFRFHHAQNALEVKKACSSEYRRRILRRFDHAYRCWSSCSACARLGRASDLLLVGVSRDFDGPEQRAHHPSPLRESDVVRLESRSLPAHGVQLMPSVRIPRAHPRPFAMTRSRSLSHRPRLLVLDDAAFPTSAVIGPPRKLPFAILPPHHSREQLRMRSRTLQRQQCCSTRYSRVPSVWR